MAPSLMILRRIHKQSKILRCIATLIAIFFGQRPSSRPCRIIHSPPSTPSTARCSSWSRADARITNQRLADRVGVAPSTALARLRSLRDRGVIRGFHAEVDLAALGDRCRR